MVITAAKIQRKNCDFIRTSFFILDFGHQIYRKLSLLFLEMLKKHPYVLKIK